jgi:hypothetical protein
MLSGAAMRRSKGSASEAGDLEVRFARAPVDRLFVGCVVALSLAYGGWLLALRLWPVDPEADARQSFHGFVTGSSQPPAGGGGEQAPAEAGEFGSSKLGTSHYFGGATSRPIAEGARVVGSTEPPEPSRARGEADATPELASPASTTGSRVVGRLGVGPRVSAWIVGRVTESAIGRELGRQGSG